MRRQVNTSSSETGSQQGQSITAEEILPIPTLLDVVIACWTAAEDELRSIVQRKYFDLGEETLTTLFHREFRAALLDATTKGVIRQSFSQDLLARYPALQEMEGGSSVAEGLVADVHLHSRRREGRTGGDFGFTLLRPQVVVQGSTIPNELDAGEDATLIGREHESGLLIQAKLWRERPRPKFTEAQKRILPQHLDYLALLLYGYDDPGGKVLREFEWQLGRGQTLTNLSAMLARQVPLARTSTSELVRRLGSGEIGTSDRHILDTVIRTSQRATFEITLTWPGGPPSDGWPVYQAVSELRESRFEEWNQTHLLARY